MGLANDLKGVFLQYIFLFYYCNIAPLIKWGGGGCPLPPTYGANGTGPQDVAAWCASTYSGLCDVRRQKTRCFSQVYVFSFSVKLEDDVVGLTVHSSLNEIQDAMAHLDTTWSTNPSMYMQTSHLF